MSDMSSQQSDTDQTVSGGSTEGSQLTRRDAIVSLTVAGLGSVAGCSGLTGNDETGTTDTEQGASGTSTGSGETSGPDANGPREDENHGMKTMRSLATVLYPSEIEVTNEFLQTYLYNRIVDDESYAEELGAAVETLDGIAEEKHGSVFRQLDTSKQKSVVTDSDVRSGASEPDGTDVERLNYYLVDELLFACYASPTGGELVGNTNPRGWPGGFGYSPEVSNE